MLAVVPMDNLTEQEYWDEYWRAIELPAEVVRSDDHSHNEILSVLDRYVPRGDGRSALEIGGAPGQYLAYLARTKGYEAHLLDYSETGCAKSRENFALLGLPLEVYHADLFAEDLHGVPRFDLVFSLGFIEHFGDLTEVIRAHTELLKPGATLVVGCPNFRGISGKALRRVAPELLAQHNLETMDLDTWDSFESEIGLTRVFRGYVGGFQPALFNRAETKSAINSAIRAASVALGVLTRPRVFKRINSPAFSHYAIGVYSASQSANSR